MKPVANPARRGLAEAAPKHLLAGTSMSSADMIIQVLADEGVDTIFGYSGGAILPTYDAVFRYNANRGGKHEVRLIVPATEQGAGFMAAGYSRSSGRVGVSLVTSGPGATNSVTPVRDFRPTRSRWCSSAGRCPGRPWGPTRSRKRPSSTSWRRARSTCS